jgi:hypothetical protein
MKFLTEIYDDVEVLVEGAGEHKQLFIHGIHAQAELVNRNKRNYSKSVLENAITKYNKDFVMTNRALGELNHPARMSVDPEHVSHRICELRWNGNDVIGKSLILNTPKGNIIKGLLEGGTKLGVSTRGAGSITLKEGVSHVGSDFVLSTIDAVLDPSGISCWVDPLMESADWIFESGVWKISDLEQAQKTIKEASSIDLKKNFLELWEKFVGNLQNMR